MKHAPVTGVRVWRAPARRRSPGWPDALTALAFNAALAALPVAATAALLVMERDDLYTYGLSAASAPEIAERVAEQNAALITVNIDRLAQWDSLVDLELRSGDAVAARGFVLSAASMAPPEQAAILAQSASDAELERAALALLSPATRERYEAEAATATRPAAFLGGPEDFELLARAMLAEPESDSLQLSLTGFALGLAGDLGERRALGAAALLLASRRRDYPSNVDAQVSQMIALAVPMDGFRRTALASGGRNAGAYTNAAAAFRASVDHDRMLPVRQLLEQLGVMAEATSPEAAAALLTHARSLRDLPRLRLLAEAAGARAAAAGKRLPRDGALLQSARGHLTLTPELNLRLAAIAGLLGVLLLAPLWQLAALVARWRRERRSADDFSGALIDLSGGNGGLRPL